MTSTVVANVPTRRSERVHMQSLRVVLRTPIQSVCISRKPHQNKKKPIVAGRKPRSNSCVPKRIWYIIDKIVDHKVKGNGQFLYHVKWLGYDDDFNTWLPIEAFAHADICLHEYYETRMDHAVQLAIGQHE